MGDLIGPKLVGFYKTGNSKNGHDQNRAFWDPQIVTILLDMGCVLIPLLGSLGGQGQPKTT